LGAQRELIQGTGKPTREPSQFSVNHEDLAFAPAFRLAEMVRAGKITPKELVDLYLSRIQAIDPVLHSFIEVYEVEAKATAELATTQAKLGRFQSPLHGIPVVVKDFFDIAGKPTTQGSINRRVVPANSTATVVKRLVGAGMIILGKTHTVELAFGGWGTNALMGTPRNPWDESAHRVPGGSSSGSAVAVSAALAPAGIGTDTGGSVRIPASMCGIVSLKPTVGRISTAGVAPLSHTLDSVGLLVRSVEDAALIFSAIEGPDAADRLTLNLPLMASLADMKRGIRGLRLAVPAEKDLEGADDCVLNRFSETLDTIKRLGATLVEIRLPDSFARCVETMSTIISAEAYHEYGDWLETQHDVDPNVRARIMAGRLVSAACYMSAFDRRRAEAGEFVALLSEYAALLTPTTQIPAVTLEEVDELKMPLSRFTRPVNYYDCCAMSLPMGLTEAGLPTSLQIIGRPFDEAGVLRIGWAVEQLGGLITGRPPLGKLEVKGDR
jgi:aspartyl-tRNA(Asn)/glutamyl-tRNA(Gln) amidotransferase subunit A